MTKTTGGDERVVEIDRWGLALASRQGALDVEIGEWLLAVREHGVHGKMGFGTLGEYVDRRLGLAPHATAERMRVAESLARLAEIRESLRGGDLSWSAARELTRVAVPETEREWLAATQGKRAHEVEAMVAGRKPGQRPTDAADPRLRKLTLSFQVSPEELAMWRENVRVMRRDVDPRLTEEECLAILARERLGGPGEDGRAPYQVAIVRCEDCGRAWQDARGESIELTPEGVERALCDAQHVGRVDGSSHVGRPRASQTIPPAVRREVLRRDRGRCRVPGCRSSTFLDVHHIRLRSEGGDHDPSNLVTMCGAHHDRMHDGLLILHGDSASPTFFHADGTPYGEKPDAAEIGTMAKVFSALRNMGWKETETKRALEAVKSHVGPGASIEEVLRAALLYLPDGVMANA